MMNILVVGSGGREHALCWRLAQSPLVTNVYCAPGNPGTATVAQNVPIAADDLAGLLAFAQASTIGLTVVGPEAALCAGIQDHFAAAGLLVFGPSAAAARLEASKAFSKRFMAQHDIPTAAFAVCERYDEAEAFIRAHQHARVIKADGLAAGKGVIVADSAEEACQAARELLDGSLGAAGHCIVVEERLYGEEVSVLALSDGQRIVPLASSQDHKAVFDGDRGPNTGGMGAYSPAPALTPQLEQTVIERVLTPTVRALAQAGTPYRGVLYAGIMLVQGRPYVLEFNCRFGDPETQPLMMRLDDDLFPHLLGAAQGTLPTAPLRWSKQAALCVVMAAQGYPGAYTRGDQITGLGAAEGAQDGVVFQAGTAFSAQQQVVTAGGRVLGVTARGDTLSVAQERAYALVRQIHWPGVHFRTDIGAKGLRVCHEINRSTLAVETPT